MRHRTLWRVHFRRDSVRRTEHSNATPTDRRPSTCRPDRPPAACARTAQSRYRVAGGAQAGSAGLPWGRSGARRVIARGPEPHRRWLSHRYFAAVREGFTKPRDARRNRGWRISRQEQRDASAKHARNLLPLGMGGKARPVVCRPSLSKKRWPQSECECVLTIFEILAARRRAPASPRHLACAHG
jgi:hypothetical protein